MPIARHPNLDDVTYRDNATVVKSEDWSLFSLQLWLQIVTKSLQIEDFVVSNPSVIYMALIWTYSFWSEYFCKGSVWNNQSIPEVQKKKWNNLETMSVDLKEWDPVQSETNKLCAGWLHPLLSSQNESLLCWLQACLFFQTAASIDPGKGRQRICSFGIKPEGLW